MGYYTWYSLEYKPYGDISEKDIISENDIAKFLFERIYYNTPYDEYFNSIERVLEEEIKWYDHDEDMKELSSMYPHTLFVLFGDGEEKDDRWCTYYLNGKMQCSIGKIVYDEFEEDLLK